MGGAEFTDSHRTLKRKHEAEGGADEGEGMEEDGDLSSSGVQTKKTCSAPASMGTGSDQQGHDLNFPIPGEDGLPCLVKVCPHFHVSADSACTIALQRL